MKKLFSSTSCRIFFWGIFAFYIQFLMPIAAFASYPDRPVRLIVPFPPGGGTDIIARALARGLTQSLSQSVIVENKPGAGTVVGSDFVAKSPPDGYNLLIATFAHAVNPAFRSNLPYETDLAFTPIILIGRSPNLLVVRAGSSFKTIYDLTATAKESPGKLFFASQGIGTSAHLAGDLFRNLSKLDIVHVPYLGAGPALNDLLGGHVDMMFATAAAAAPFLQSKKLRALAVTTAERSPAFPDIPTIAESGVLGYEAESWYGLYAPAGTASEVVKKIYSSVKAAIESNDFQATTRYEGLITIAGTPEELANYVRSEHAKWAKLLKSNGIKPE